MFPAPRSPHFFLKPTPQPRSFSPIGVSRPILVPGSHYVTWTLLPFNGPPIPVFALASPSPTAHQALRRQSSQTLLSTPATPPSPNCRSRAAGRRALSAVPPAPGPWGGARPPPPRPTPGGSSGTSVAPAPAASRDDVSCSCPDHGFGIGRWVVTTGASPGPRTADSERSLGPRPRGKEDNKSLENNNAGSESGSESRARPALGINICYGSDWIFST